MGTVANLGNQAFAKIQIKYDGLIVKSNTHLILVLDCSGSMLDQIGKLRDDVKKFVNSLNSDTKISIIVFSGHRQSRLIIKATNCTEEGKKLLCDAVDRDIEIMGCTVFSEALQKAIKIANFTNTNHMLVLFTDGCPVPVEWSKQEEISRAVTEVQTMRGMGVGLSCLGYGAHYNGLFLEKLMGACGNNGILEHMDVVGGKFSELVTKIFDITRRTKFGKLEFEIKGGGNAFKVTPQALVVGLSGKISFNGLLDGETTIFVELSQDVSSLDISGSFEGENFSMEITTNPASSEINYEFMVGKASIAMTIGRNNEAAELFDLVGLNELSYRAKASNTATEKRRFATKMRYYYVNRDWIGAGLKDQGPNRCGINAIRLIAEGCEAGEVVIRVDRYQRTGIRMIKEGVVSGKGNPILVTRVTSHDYRMNFGFTTLDSGAKVATDSGFRQFNNFKTYLVIADGDYHDAQFSASFTQSYWFLKLQEAGVIVGDAVWKIGEFYRLFFNEDLPVVSPNFARPGALGLVPLLREEAELELKQTALNAHIKKLRKDGDVEYVASPKQSKDEELVVDMYEAACCKYKIMRYKASTPPDYSTTTYDQALSERSKVKSRLNQVRFMYRTIRAACEISGSKVINWVDVKANNSDKTIQRAEFDEALLQREAWNQMVEYS